MQCFSLQSTANGVKYCHYYTRNTHFYPPNSYSYKPSIPRIPFSIPTLELKNLVVKSRFNKPISVISRKNDHISGLRLYPVLCGNSSNAETAKKSSIEAVGEAISTAFPLWVALGCSLGLVKPSSFNWVKPQWTVMGITLTMLGMGMTLTFDDLRSAMAMPKELFSGFMLQYSVISSFLFDHLLHS